MILFFGDTQIQADRPVTMDDWDLDTPMTDRVSQMCKTAMWIRERIEEYDPETVIFMGDLNESKGDLSPYTVYLIREMSKIWFSGSRNYYSILGNHDMVDPYGDCNTHVMFPRNVKTIVPNSPRRIGEDVLLASFFRDTEKYMKSLKNVKEDWTLLVTHISVKGMQFNTGFREEKGVDFSNKFFNEKAAVLGHYHRPITRTFGNTPVITSGATMYHDFGDEWDSDRGILLLNNGGSFSTVKNPYTKRYIKVSLPEDQDILDNAIQEYGRENLNLRYKSGAKLEGDDVSEFASVRKLPEKKKQNDIRINSITVDSSYKDDMEAFVMDKDIDLDKKKVLDIGTNILNSI